MKRTAFTMVELIFVIVIIGVLASIGLPKLSGVSDNAKKTAEIATVSAVSTSIESAHGEWSINEGIFKWGNNQPSSALDPRSGYPTELNNSVSTFGAVLKNDAKDFTKYTIAPQADYTISIFTGQASNPTNGVKIDTKAPNSDIAGKPDKNDFWIYASYTNPNKVCTYGTKTLYSGDLILIDVTGTSATTLTSITLTCN